MKIKLDAKHVLSVVAVLALIGGGAGALIGTVNYFTSPLISENNDKTQLAAYYACFPDAAEIGDANEVEGGTYIASYRIAKDASGNEIGRCYLTKSTPVSTFGNLTAVIGIDKDGKPVHVEITENTQSIPGSTNEYAEFINGGGNYEEVPTYTGGTIGVSVLGDMIDEALELHENGFVTPPVTGGEKYYGLFEGGASAGEEVSLQGMSYLDHYREVNDASGNVLGRGYLGGGLNVFGVSINIIVGVTPEGEVTKLFLDEYEGGEQMGTDVTIENWVDEVNSGDREWTAGPSAGASYEIIKGVIDEAIAHYTGPAVVESVIGEDEAKSLFEGASSVGAESALEGEYVRASREVKDAGGALLGTAYYGEGTNQHGVHVAILVGLTPEGEVAKLSLEDYSGGNPIGTEEVISAWIDSINGGSATIDGGTTTGATVSATLIRNIVSEAKGYATGTVVDLTEKYLGLFRNAATVGEEVALSGDYEYIVSYREVKNESGEVLGRGYLTNTTNVGGKWGDLQLPPAPHRHRAGRRDFLDRHPRQRAEPAGRDQRLHRVRQRRRILRGHLRLRVLERHRRHRDRA